MWDRSLKRVRADEGLRNSRPRLTASPAAALVFRLGTAFRISLRCRVRQTKARQGETRRDKGQHAHGSKTGGDESNIR